MILLDVDGVLTDGGLVLIGSDWEAKRFDVQDGMGINLARSVGIMIGIVTSRSSTVVQRRAEELKLDVVFQGIRNKVSILEILGREHHIEPGQTAFIGDDLQDIPIMRKVGLPIAVQNARSQVKASSVYVTDAAGGHGAVREAVEWILELRGVKQEAFRLITGE